MASQQEFNAELAKHRVYTQRRFQTVKATVLLSLTVIGVSSALAWEFGVGYWVADRLGMFSASASVDPVYIEALGTATIGCLSVLPLQPVAWVLRKLMVPPPTVYGLESSDLRETSGTSSSTRLSKTMGVLAAVSIFIGAPVSLFALSGVFSTPIIHMLGTISAFFAWFLFGACCLQAHRALKR